MTDSVSYVISPTCYHVDAKGELFPYLPVGENGKDKVVWVGGRHVTLDTRIPFYYTGADLYEPYAVSHAEFCTGGMITKPLYWLTEGKPRKIDPEVPYLVSIDIDHTEFVTKTHMPITFEACYDAELRTVCIESPTRILCSMTNYDKVIVYHADGRVMSIYRENTELSVRQLGLFSMLKMRHDRLYAHIDPGRTLIDPGPEARMMYQGQISDLLHLAEGNKAACTFFNTISSSAGDNWNAMPQLSAPKHEGSIQGRVVEFVPRPAFAKRSWVQ